MVWVASPAHPPLCSSTPPHPTRPPTHLHNPAAPHLHLLRGSHPRGHGRNHGAAGQLARAPVAPRVRRRGRPACARVSRAGRRWQGCCCKTAASWLGRGDSNGALEHGGALRGQPQGVHAVVYAAWRPLVSCAPATAAACSVRGVLEPQANSGEPGGPSARLRRHFTSFTRPVIHLRSSMFPEQRPAARHSMPAMRPVPPTINEGNQQGGSLAIDVQLAAGGAAALPVGASASKRGGSGSSGKAGPGGSEPKSSVEGSTSAPPALDYGAPAAATAAAAAGGVAAAATAASALEDGATALRAGEVPPLPPLLPAESSGSLEDPSQLNALAPTATLRLGHRVLPDAVTAGTRARAGGAGGSAQPLLHHPSNQRLLFFWGAFPVLSFQSKYNGPHRRPPA